jgi:hypothetical protein
LHPIGAEKYLSGIEMFKHGGIRGSFYGRMERCIATAKGAKRIGLAVMRLWSGAHIPASRQHYNHDRNLLLGPNRGRSRDEWHNRQQLQDVSAFVHSKPKSPRRNPIYVISLTLASTMGIHVHHSSKLLFAFAVFVGGLAAAADQVENRDWPAVFREDLAAIRQIIYTDHPGPVDVLNPDFVEWLDAGFEQQLLLADRVDSADAYVYALQKYVAGFRDGHLNIRFDIERGAPRWPGFLTTWRNGAVVVHTVDTALADVLPEGSRLLSCDGLSPETILARRVFDYRYNPDLPANWVRAAAGAFVDNGNPFVAPPASCMFLHEGREITLELSWRPLSWEERRGDYDAARGMLRADVGLHTPENSVLWLKAPTFGPSAEQAAIYHQSFRELRDSRRSARLVVFDLRGNNGGSSMWASEFAQALWNEVPETSGEDEDDSFVEWRVSKGNIAYWTTVPQFISDQFGVEHQAVRWAEYVLENLRIASKNGKQLWRETPVDDVAAEPAQATGSVSAGDPVYTGTVVLLTNNTCGSACLDAMSLLSPLPGVVHAGSVTSADTQYMEARPVALPSNLATLVIPIKVYRGRVRPDGGYFTPQFRFDGLHWTDEALESWLLSLWHDGALDTREAN